MQKELRLPQKRQPICDRFWSRVECSPDSCWTWIGTIKNDGYGTIRTGPGKRWIAHRLSWVLHYGEIPEGMFVCHHCDNPACVRPDHLFIGRPKDNTQDMVRKGRAKGGHAPLEFCRRGLHDMSIHGVRRKHGRRCRLCNNATRNAREKEQRAKARGYEPYQPKGQIGEAHPGAKISDAMVVEIRELYLTKAITQDTLAKIYGVSQTHVSRIVRIKQRRSQICPNKAVLASYAHGVEIAKGDTCRDSHEPKAR